MALIENYTTKVAASRTASEIQELLAAHGVTKIMLEYVAGRASGITFEVPTQLGPRAFTLPVDVNAMHQLLVSEKRAGRLPGVSVPMAESVEHAERVAWRVVAEWLRAQMTLIATKMATFDQVMLPYLVVGNQTLYAAYLDRQLELATGHDFEEGSST